MTAKARKIPSYRLHKPTGQSVVRLDGRDFYLGKYGTEESREAYHRKVAEWLVRGRVAETPPPRHADAALQRTVNDLVLEYWHHAEGRYRRADGSSSSELGWPRGTTPTGCTRSPPPGTARSGSPYWWSPGPSWQAHRGCRLRTG